MHCQDHPPSDLPGKIFYFSREPAKDENPSAPAPGMLKHGF